MERAEDGLKWMVLDIFYNETFVRPRHNLFFTQLKMIKIHFWGSHYLRGSKNSIVSYLVLQGVFLMCSFHNEIRACWDNFLGLKLSFALLL